MKRLFKWLSILFACMLLGVGGLAFCSSGGETPESAAATEAPAIVESAVEGADSTAAATAEPAVESIAVAEPTAEPTSEPTAKPTSEPTAEPLPTATPAPTETATAVPPTATPEPLPEPSIFTGSGDSIIDLEDWPIDEAGILHIIGPSVNDNFVVESYNDLGEQVDLLVNVIGAYEGYQPHNFFNEQVSRLVIQAGGPWTIELRPLSMEDVHQLEVPGSYTGAGDDVVFLTGATPDLAIVKSGNQSDNFVIWSYGNQRGRDLLVNEIAPYEGTVILSRDTIVLIVQAGQSGSWTVDVTTR